MSQTSKLFIVLGFMFLLFTTMNGHLEQYLRILFGSKSTSQTAQVNTGGSTNIVSDIKSSVDKQAQGQLTSAFNRIGM